MNKARGVPLNREPLRELCYWYIARIKWAIEPYYCKGKNCSGGKYKARKYDIVTYKRIPFSRQCKVCGHVESPTAETCLHDFKNIPAFFEVAKCMLEQRTLSRRLTSTEIFKIVNGKDCLYYSNQLKAEQFVEKWYDEMLNDSTVNSTEKDTIRMYQKGLKTKRVEKLLSAQTVNKYRKLIQSFIKNYFENRNVTKMPVAICKLEIENRGEKKYVFISRQLTPNGHIRARVYDKDNYDNLLNFLKNSIGVTTNIIIFDWNKKYDSIKNKIPTIQFRDDEMPYKEMVVEIKDVLNSWLKGLVLSDIVSVQHAINECIFLRYYNFVTIPSLVKLMLLFGKKPLKVEN